jgi:hypothetical protein
MRLLFAFLLATSLALPPLHAAPPVPSGNNLCETAKNIIIVGSLLVGLIMADGLWSWMEPIGWDPSEGELDRPAEYDAWALEPPRYKKGTFRTEVLGSLE